MLPGGSNATRSSYSLLDAVWCDTNQTFYILDLICYRAHPVDESEVGAVNTIEPALEPTLLGVLASTTGAATAAFKADQSTKHKGKRGTKISADRTTQVDT